MATRIGGKYRLEDVRARHWVKFASEVRLPASEVLDMGKAMAESVPEAFATTVSEARAAGLDHPILQRMLEMVTTRSERCARRLEAASD